MRLTQPLLLSQEPTPDPALLSPYFFDPMILVLGQTKGTVLESSEEVNIADETYLRSIPSSNLILILCSIELSWHPSGRPVSDYNN